MMDSKRLQRDMQMLGYYTAKVDGLWGPKSEAAYQAWFDKSYLLKPLDDEKPSESLSPNAMAWGKKVSQEFKDRVRWIAQELELPPEGADWLMACMAFESAETFRADIRNAAGSGATGLIQFMPRTAEGLQTTTDQLAAMTPENQLNFVYLYFKPYKGRIKNLGDMYMAILWPRGVGKPDEWVLWDAEDRPTTYRQNAGLDTDGDKQITRGEAVAKVRAKLVRGRQFYYG
jgi:hypothetical protein